MKWAEPKRELTDLFEDLRKEEVQTSTDQEPEAKKEKTPPLRVGPHWEVDDVPPSDFVKDFFKPA